MDSPQQPAQQDTEMAVAADESAAPQPQQPKLSRKEQELARKDRTLAEFLVLMDQYQPIVCWPRKATASLTV